MKKCKKCGAPLEGFLYNTIGKLLGLKPSEKDPEMCNKCEADTEEKTEGAKPAEEIVTKVETPVASVTPEAPVEPEVKEDKDELIS